MNLLEDNADEEVLENQRSLLEVKLLNISNKFHLFYGETRTLSFLGDESINNTKRTQKRTERGP